LRKWLLLKFIRSPHLTTPPGRASQARARATKYALAPTAASNLALRTIEVESHHEDDADRFPSVAAAVAAAAAASATASASGAIPPASASVVVAAPPPSTKPRAPLPKRPFLTAVEFGHFVAPYQDKNLKATVRALYHALAAAAIDSSNPTFVRTAKRQPCNIRRDLRACDCMSTTLIHPLHIIHTCV
jgi:hypothetical protein